MGHVNNAVYLTYCEMARIQYWTDVTGEPVAAGHEGAESLILAEARITYRAPVFHAELVTVETRATRIGSSSFTLEHRLTACPPGGAPRLVAVERVDHGPLRLRDRAAGRRSVRARRRRSRPSRAGRSAPDAPTAARLSRRRAGRSRPRSGRRTRSR